jgi:hypothetical protein
MQDFFLIHNRAILLNKENNTIKEVDTKKLLKTDTVNGKE